MLRPIAPFTIRAPQGDSASTPDFAPLRAAEAFLHQAMQFQYQPGVDLHDELERAASAVREVIIGIGWKASALAKPRPRGSFAGQRDSATTEGAVLDVDVLAAAQRRLVMPDAGPWEAALPEHQEHWRKQVAPLAREYRALLADVPDEGEGAGS